MALSKNPRTAVSRALMKDRNPRVRQVGRMLSRGRVAAGSQLDLAISIAAQVMKDTGGPSGGGGPATGAPMIGSDVYTPTPSSGRRKKVSRLSKVDYDLAQ